MSSPNEVKSPRATIICRSQVGHPAPCEVSLARNWAAYILRVCLWQMTRLLVCPRWLSGVYALLMDSAAPISNWSGNPDRPGAARGPWSPARLFTICSLPPYNSQPHSSPAPGGQCCILIFLKLTLKVLSWFCLRGYYRTLPKLQYVCGEWRRNGSMWVGRGELRWLPQLEIGRLFCASIL